MRLPIGSLQLSDALWRDFFTALDCCYSLEQKSAICLYVAAPMVGELGEQFLEKFGVGMELLILSQHLGNISWNNKFLLFPLFILFVWAGGAVKPNVDLYWNKLFRSENECTIERDVAIVSHAYLSLVSHCAVHFEMILHLFVNGKPNLEYAFPIPTIPSARHIGLSI